MCDARVGSVVIWVGRDRQALARINTNASSLIRINYLSSRTRHIECVTRKILSGYSYSCSLDIVLPFPKLVVRLVVLIYYCVYSSLK